MVKRLQWLLTKIKVLIMPHIYDLNPNLKERKEPTISKEKAPAPKNRGRPKGSKNKK